MEIISESKEKLELQGAEVPEEVKPKSDVIEVEEGKEGESKELEGLDPREVAMAKKNKLIVKPGTLPKEEVIEKKDEPKEKTKDELKKSPDVQEAFDNPEKETEILKDFNTNEKGLYFTMKKERAKRQAAEAVREQDQLRVQLAEKKASKLEQELAEEKARKKEVVVESPKPKLDDFGNPITEVKPEDKPLTKKDLEDIDAKKTKEEKDKQDKANEDKLKQKVRAKQIMAVIDSQEAEVRAEHDDFDAVVTLSEKVYLAARQGKLLDMFQNKKVATKALKMCQLFEGAYLNADQIKEGEWSAADIAYEIGKMHPDFNKKVDGTSSENSEGTDNLSSEQTKKLVENVDKRKPSGSISTGSGKTFVKFETMTAEQGAKLPYDQYVKVPKSIRDKWLREA